MRSFHDSLRLAVILLSLVSNPSTGIAQGSADGPREQVVKSITEQAERDVKLGRPAQSPQDLKSLFDEAAQSAGLNLLDVAAIYDEAYDKAKNRKPWYESLIPNVGWIAAVLLFVLLIFRDIIKEALTSMIRALRKSIYLKVSGHRFVRRFDLRRYRRALIKKYQEIKIPFRPDRPLKLKEIYVPLKVKGNSDQDKIDASRALGSYKKLMIVGPPGSGKSMLLKHIALSYAQEQTGLVPESVVPILLELNRLNEEDRTIEDHLIEVLKLNDFPNSRDFVYSSLERGSLMILFDGLDEVNTVRREQVVKKIRDILDTFEKCRAVITCRNAVYRNEFADVVDQTLEIIEFSDQQIQSFLGAWQQYMPPGKSIEQLILTLRERPRIMALARNPLLLTIIAYLYIDTEFVLPHSRAEFYGQAIDVLLRQWKGESNLFKAPVKGLVLQHLALFNQNRGVEGNQDRRSIDLKTILEEIKRVLPDLNLENEEATPLLEEIVERSGLMLSIDGGARFQFAHLTLQEFFAASALRDDGEGLLERFNKDRDAWRETVKLWCGLDHDSTKMIQEVYKVDAITAFECLADAQKISPPVASEIIDHFKDKLIDDSNDDVIKAFAAVASGPSARAKEVFNFLVSVLGSDEDEARSKAAAISLSLTNQPVAVGFLMEYYSTKTYAREALVKMGDLAVPALIELAKAEPEYEHTAPEKALLAKDPNTDEIINLTEAYSEDNASRISLLDLREIGTPQAAAAIVHLLWGTGDQVSIAAALRTRGNGMYNSRSSISAGEQLSSAAAFVLASLLPRPGVEDALRSLPNIHEEQQAKLFKWVWAPFDEPPGSSLPKIAARIGWQISQAVSKPIFIPSFRLDPRIVIPLAVHEINEISGDLGTRQYIGETLLYLLDKVQLKDIANEKQDEIDADAVTATFFRIDKNILGSFSTLMRYSSSELSPELIRIVPLLKLFFFLDPVFQRRLLTQFLRPPTPTITHWQNQFRPVIYSFDRSWHFSMVVLMLTLVTFIALLGIIQMIGESRAWITGENGALGLAGIYITCCFTGFSIANPIAKDLYYSLFSLFVFPFMVVKDILAGNFPSSVLDDPPPLIVVPFFPLVAFFATIKMLDYFTPIGAGVIWASLFIIGLLLTIIGRRKEASVYNPLKDILNPEV